VLDGGLKTDSALLVALFMPKPATTEFRALRLRAAAIVAIEKRLSCKEAAALKKI